MIKHVPDALELKNKPLEAETNSKCHTHVFLYPSPNGYNTIGVCSCGVIQQGFNSDKFLEHRKDNHMHHTLQSNPSRWMPDNPVDSILEHSRRNGRAIHIWQHESVNYI